MKFISPCSDYSCFASIRDVIADQTISIQLSNIHSALIYVITANGTLCTSNNKRTYSRTYSKGFLSKNNKISKRSTTLNV